MGLTYREDRLYPTHDGWDSTTLEHSICSRIKRRVRLLVVSKAYLQVKELAVSPVDDVGSGVRVSDVDEVHLVGEARAQTQRGSIRKRVTLSKASRHHSSSTLR